MNESAAVENAIVDLLGELRAGDAETRALGVGTMAAELGRPEDVVATAVARLLAKGALAQSTVARGRYLLRKSG